MTKKAIIKKLDDALRPIGFVRRKATWNRWSDSLVEVIDIQFAKDDDDATMNVGVLDPAVYVKVWRREPPLFVQEPECTIRARVGELIDGKDRWWELSDSQGDQEMRQALLDYVLPFIERMHSRQMAQWLIGSRVSRKKYPPPILSLAVLQHLLGRSSEACTLLTDLRAKTVETWIGRVEEVAADLDCATPGA